MGFVQFWINMVNKESKYMCTWAINLNDISQDSNGQQQLEVQTACMFYDNAEFQLASEAE